MRSRTRWYARVAWWATVAVSCVGGSACDGAVVPADGGGSPDGASDERDGSTRRDGSTQRDGSTPRDASSSPDGSSARDGGAVDPIPTIPAIEPWTPRACGAGVECVSSLQTIQAAVDRVSSGGVVQIAAGTYRENVVVRGKRVLVIGGFSADFSTWDPNAHPTRVEAPSGTIFTLDDASGSRLQGLVIHGGTGSCRMYYGCDGGGVYATGGSYDILGNVIEASRVPGINDEGGGIYLDGSGRIQGNLIRDNEAGKGAAMAVFYGSEMLIADNVVEDNRGLGDHGGGLYVAGRGEVTVARNVIRRNAIGVEAGYGWGGGAILFGSSLRGRLYGNVFEANHAPSTGSGLFIDEDASAVSENDLFFDNTCPSDGGSAIYVDEGPDGGTRFELINATIAGNCRTSAVYLDGICSVEVRNSIIVDVTSPIEIEDTGTIAISYSLIEGGFAGPGNIDADPMFESPAADDYRLRAGSPAIDAADPVDAYDREPPPNGGRRDLGHTGNTTEATRS